MAYATIALLLTMASMMAIWYLMATSGSVPDSICPVIMPGSVTMPIADMVSIWGRNDAFIDSMTIGADASRYVAPMPRSVSMLRCSFFTVAWNRSYARAQPFMALPIIMPPSGMAYRGSRSGSSRVIRSRNTERTDPAPSAMEMMILRRRVGERYPTRPKTMRDAIMIK